MPRSCRNNILSLVTLGALFLTGCGTPKWETFQSPQGQFSISMPGKPNQEEKPVDLPGGSSVPLKIASLESSGVAYFTGYVDYPQGLVSNPALNVQDILAGSIKGAASSEFGGGQLTQTETTVNNVPCRSFKTSGKLEQKDARMEGVFCLKGDRLFEVLVIGEDKESFTEAAQKFISSFEIKES